MPIDRDMYWEAHAAAFDRLSSLEVAEAPEAEAPEATPYTPSFGDIVTVADPVTRGYTIREGQIGYVEHVRLRRNESGCRATDCPECDSQLQIGILSITPAEADEIWAISYIRVRGSHVSPARPSRAGQTVRCSRPTFSHNRHHRYNPSECVDAVRNIGDSDGISPMRTNAERIYATEVAERAAEVTRREERLGAIRPGEIWEITSQWSDWPGYLARIRTAPDRRYVTAEILDRSGVHVRRSVTLNLGHLGTRLSAWQIGNAAPRYIAWTTPTYATAAARAAVTDIAVPDSDDAHECDHVCFNYGCSALSSQEDNEPDIFLGNVPIMPYSHQPILRFSGEGPVFLGTELELSGGVYDRQEADRHARKAAKILTEDPAVGPLVYLKSDGSINGVGFEAVFHPMSYDWIVQNWPEDLLRRMREAGMIPHSSCGMHVHVSRSGFSGPVHAFSWIKFWYRNARTMSAMARRDPSSWGSFERPSERAAAKWHAKGGYGAENRYTAVNCSNPHTYEVRVFASTLNRNRFLGSLGLVDASVEYTRQLTTEAILRDGGWSFDRFRSWVSDFDKYMPLRKEIARLVDVAK